MERPNLHKVAALQNIEVREGVVLRPLVTADAAALLAILDADPSIRERVGVASRLHTAKDLETLLDEEKDDPSVVRYGICEHDTVVGLINFWRAGDYFGDKASPDDYGFGYFLAPSARGRGLVTSGLTVLMAVAVTELNAKQFIAFCETDNLASGAVLQKAGFAATDMTWNDAEHGWTERKYLRTVEESPAS